MKIKYNGDEIIPRTRFLERVLNKVKSIYLLKAYIYIYIMHSNPPSSLKKKCNL